jgi:hypothetical protein
MTYIGGYLMSQESNVRPRINFRTLSVILTIIALLLVTAPAMAIVYGEPDGDDHPFVGAIVIVNQFEDVVLLEQWCSGTLIAEDVFLTAAHCKYFLDPLLEDFPNAEVLITFDSSIDIEQGTFYTGEWFLHPDFNAFQGPNGLSDPRDVAVIILDKSPGIVPASLPPAGLLDELMAAKKLRHTRFTAVGYGKIRETHQGAFDSIVINLDRNRAEQGFFSLTQAWLTLPMLPMVSSGGTCYGDSGGPHFIHLNGEETDIIASITVTGDAVCKATDKTYRMDTPVVREFLGQFVTLP